ncbi:MAG: hypothetical protein KKD77_20240 [Gammaproteobacteria bacterium]|nr:hypothetical protein [Gammaproteobacteria bacterium]
MKKYNGTIYVGIAEGDIEYAAARDSIHGLILRPGDSSLNWTRATKGYEARQEHLNRFLDTKHDFAALLDGDMVFDPATLERLRRHELPFVSGLYMRRSTKPVAPVWYKPYSGFWPIEPWTDPVKEGALYRLGASGWGCVLVHREVVLAVRDLLKGEWEVLEDDMDIWPYDLREIMRAIHGIRSLVDEQPASSTCYPALREHLETLEKQIRPLRCDREIIGSDIRFAWFANQAGFPLWGDPDVRPGHIIQYPLSATDYNLIPDEARMQLQKNVRKAIREDYQRITAEMDICNGK